MKLFKITSLFCFLVINIALMGMDSQKTSREALIKQIQKNSKKPYHRSNIEELIDQETSSVDEFRQFYHSTSLHDMFVRMERKLLFYPASRFGRWGMKKIKSKKKIILESHLFKNISDANHLNETIAMIGTFEKSPEVEQPYSVDKFNIPEKGQYLILLPNKTEFKENYTPICLSKENEYFILPHKDRLLAWKKDKNLLTSYCISNTRNTNLVSTRSLECTKTINSVSLDKEKSHIIIHFVNESPRILNFNFEDISTKIKLATFLSSLLIRKTPRHAKPIAKDKDVSIQTIFPHLAHWTWMAKNTPILELKQEFLEYWLYNKNKSKKQLIQMPSNNLISVGFSKNNLLFLYTNPQKIPHIKTFNLTTYTQKDYPLVMDTEQETLALAPNDPRSILTCDKQSRTTLTIHDLQFTDNTKKKLALRPCHNTIFHKPILSINNSNGYINVILEKEKESIRMLEDLDPLGFD